MHSHPGLHTLAGTATRFSQVASLSGMHLVDTSKRPHVIGALVVVDGALVVEAVVPEIKID